MATSADERDERLAYMGGTAKEHKAVILKSGGIEDHVQLLIKTHSKQPTRPRGKACRNGGRK